MKFTLIHSTILLAMSSAALASPLPDFPFINVTGMAKLDVAPDSARVQLVIRHTGATAEAATQAVYQQSARLLQFLQTQGVTEEDIEAAQLDKSALYKDYNDRTITGYEASQPVTLTLKQLTNYAAIMDFLFKQPQIFNIQASFDSSQREQHEQKLSQLAGENARQRAQQLAAVQGVKISSVFAISDTADWGSLAGDFGFSAGAVSYGMLRKADMAQSTGMLVLPKHISLEKSVKVIYKIKP